MTPILGLPVELLLDIFGLLDGPGDLHAVCDTCTKLRAIKTTKPWDGVLQKVYEKETLTTMTAELYGLWAVRKIKASAGNSQQKLMDSSIPFHQAGYKQDQKLLPAYEKDITAHITEIAKLRRTIRWYTLRYLKQHLKGDGNSLYCENDRKLPGSTSCELKDMYDNAFCLVWLWIEASYVSTKRWSGDIDTMVAWALAGPFWPGGHNPGFVLNACRFIQEELSAACEAFTEVPVNECLYRRMANGPFGCGSTDRLTPYTNWPLSNMRNILPDVIMIALGVDGVRDMLETPLKQQVALLDTYCYTTYLPPATTADSQFRETGYFHELASRYSRVWLRSLESRPKDNMPRPLSHVDRDDLDTAETSLWIRPARKLRSSVWFPREERQPRRGHRTRGQASSGEAGSH
ncbi:hypothetical protein TWF696_000119 [Orbilia brochopaga]|uniref:F-box domain-containing protein n=1 Tax=Orbilia brochopaga TaxID=3140254 RepID=A0AAV9VGR4_9PEZI